jgi:hypothetical protein
VEALPDRGDQHVRDYRYLDRAEGPGYPFTVLNPLSHSDREVLLPPNAFEDFHTVARSNEND